MTKILVAQNLMLLGEPTMLPHHEHDCDKCVFLGNQFEGADVDFWFCPSELSVIFRFGSDGDYGSLPLSFLSARAEIAGPGSTWSQLLSRHDDWVGSGGGKSQEWDDEPEYVTKNFHYNHVQLKETERTIFFRDSAGNPLGVAQKDAFLAHPGEETFAFRAELRSGISQSLQHQMICSRKALFLYVEFLLQTALDAGE